MGLWSAYHLPIDAVPDITNPQVQVNTEVLALAPEETEKAVTVPLEMELSGIQGVEEMRSLTKFGLSQVTLIFQDGMDIYRARQLVAERLQAVTDRAAAGPDAEAGAHQHGPGRDLLLHRGLACRRHQPPGRSPGAVARAARAARIYHQADAPHHAGHCRNQRQRGL